jgi:hypothetical protein
MVFHAIFQLFFVDDSVHQLLPQGSNVNILDLKVFQNCAEYAVEDGLLVSNKFIFDFVLFLQDLFTKFDDKVHIIILHQSHGSEAINCIMGI